MRRPTIHKLSILGMTISCVIIISLLISLVRMYGYNRPTRMISFAGGSLLVLSSPHLWAEKAGWRWKDWEGGMVCWLPKVRTKGPVTGVGVPLWIPFVVVFVPSLLAWRSSRKYRPGYCRKCSYDLYGNESGVCPECGTKVE